MRRPPTPRREHLNLLLCTLEFGDLPTNLFDAGGLHDPIFRRALLGHREIMLLGWSRRGTGGDTVHLLTLQNTALIFREEVHVLVPLATNLGSEP